MLIVHATLLREALNNVVPELHPIRVDVLVEAEEDGKVDATIRHRQQLLLFKLMVYEGWWTRLNDGVIPFRFDGCLRHIQHRSRIELFGSEKQVEVPHEGRRNLSLEAAKMALPPLVTKRHFEMLTCHEISLHFGQ